MDTSVDGLADELTRVAAAFRRLATDLDDAGPPRGGDGSPAPPRAGAAPVQAYLDGHGLIYRFTVAETWRRELGVEDFAGAVERAGRDAVEGHTPSATPIPLTPGVRETLDQLARWAAGGPAPTAEATPGRPGSAAQTGVAGAAARDRTLDAVLAEAGSTADRLAAAPSPLSGAQGALAIGSAAGGRLTIGIGAAGAVSCVANPDWVARQDATELTEALNRALSAARADLTWQGPAVPVGELDQLLADTLTALRALGA